MHKSFSFLILNLKWNSQYGLESLSDHCAGQNDQQKSHSAHFPFQQDLTTSCTFIAALGFSPAIHFICTLFKDRATRWSILSMRSICCGDLFFPVFHASEPLMVISAWMLSLTAPCDGCKWSQCKPFISPSLIRTYLYAWQWEKSTLCTTSGGGVQCAGMRNVMKQTPHITITDHRVCCCDCTLCRCRRQVTITGVGGFSRAIHGSVVRTFPHAVKCWHVRRAQLTISAHKVSPALPLELQNRSKMF